MSRQNNRERAETESGQAAVTQANENATVTRPVVTEPKPNGRLTTSASQYQHNRIQANTEISDEERSVMQQNGKG